MPQADRAPSYELRRGRGPVDPRRIFTAPGILLFIAVVNIAVTVFFYLAPTQWDHAVLAAAALIPERFVMGSEANGGLARMISPLFTHMFIHGGPAHLILNMLFLLAFGASSARRMGAEHALRSLSAFAASMVFIAFYLLCGAAGGLAFIAFNFNAQTLLVGASGGVFGLLGALTRYAFNRSSLFGPEHTRFNGLTDRTVLIWSFFVVATNNPLAVGALSPVAGGAAIAWEAHLGGYIMGMLIYPTFERTARIFSSSS